MRLLQKKTEIDFMGMRHLWVGLSVLLLGMSVFLWFKTGDEKFGVDFRGGTELVVRFNADVTAANVRSAFDAAGIQESIVQAFENGNRDFSIRVPGELGSAENRTKTASILQGISSGGYTLLKEDFVGPVIGAQIRRDAYYSIILSLIAILSYVGFRFEWRFGAGGIIALLHDVIIASGFCLLTGRQMSAGILAALLTIVGYSINDTIIVYDRIRENMAKSKRSSSKNKLEDQTKGDLMAIMNLSINETLSRTILTSMTAFLVCMTLWLFGGGAVSDLSFALMVGVLVGTYSSIFTACPFVLMFQKKK